MILGCVLTILCYCFDSSPVYTYFDKYDGIYYFYTSQNFDSKYTETIKNGNEYIVSCDILKVKAVYNMLNKKCIRGESCVLYNTNLQDIVYDLGIEYIQYNYDEIIGFSKKIDYKVYLDNCFYNTQIVQDDNVIKIGFPMILGSF